MRIWRGVRCSAFVDRYARSGASVIGTSATRPGSRALRVLGRGFWDTGALVERNPSRRSVSVSTGILGLGLR
jgi:hypothetical protein